MDKKCRDLFIIRHEQEIQPENDHKIVVKQIAFYFLLKCAVNIGPLFSRLVSLISQQA